MLRPLTRDDVTITVEALPEDMAPEEHFATGDDEQDRKICAEIREKAEQNEWAWCCIKVTASWWGHRASDYLGGCCYDSKEDFIAQNDYYPDMVDRALEELNAEVLSDYETLKTLETSSTP